MKNITSNIFFVLSVDILSLLIAIAGVYHVSQKSGLPFHFIDNNHITITESGADESGKVFNPGDVILYIDDYQVNNSEELETITDGKNIGSRIEIKIMSETGIKSLHIELVPYYSMRYIIIMILTGLLYMSLGVAIYLKKRDNKAANIYHWASIFVGLIITTTWGNYNIHPHGLGYILRIVFLFAYCLSPVLYFHFSISFPSRKGNHYFRLLKYLYPAAILLGLSLSAVFVFTVTGNISYRHLFTQLFDAGRIFFALCIIFSIFSFVLSYRYAKEESERRMLRWVFLGLSIAALGFVCLWQIPQMLYGRGLIDEDMVLVITLFAPISFSIALLKYHILDIDMIFRRSTLYLIIILIMITFYGLVILVTQFFISKITYLSSFLILALSSVSLALLLDPIKRNAQKFVDKKFFRVQYDYKIALKNIIEGINHQPDPEHIADYLCHSISNLLFVKYIAVFIFDAAENGSPLLKSYNYSNGSYSNLTEDIISCRNRTIKAEATKYSTEPGADINPNLNNFIKDSGIALLHPMISGKFTTSGFIVTGDKLSGKRFSHEDLYLLSAISQEAGYAVDNYILQQKIILESKESARLKELNEIKSYFVSSVSHELKTPLTSIKLFIELIKGNPNIPHDTLEDYLTTIESEANRLTKLVENILDYSKMERGIREYNFSPIDLNMVTRNAIIFLAPQIKLYNYTIELIEENEELIIFADLDSVSRSINNLISNAMKYSYPETPIVIRTFKKENLIGISISDQGIGIEKEELEEIFKPFFRSRKVSAGSISGTGIGLSIVKEVMHAHKGTVDVDSEINKGSKFTLLFPGVE